MRVPFKRQIQHVKNRLYLSSPAQKENIRKTELQSPFDLVSIAFNNEVVISCQIKLLKKYLLDKFDYTVIDNSPDTSKQKKIENICAENGVNYLLPPENPFQGQPGSGSHGITLNWAYNNFIAPRKPRYFGFLDHDIFPVGPTSVLEHFSHSDIFGKIDVREDRWYLWSGFCFFKFDFLEGKKVDFMPVPGLGTGGKNWYSIYSKFDRSRIPHLEISIENIRPGDNKQADQFERIGSWIHTINASEWVSAPHKNALVTQLLDSYL